MLRVNKKIYPVRIIQNKDFGGMIKGGLVHKNNLIYSN